ncbi:MAG: hypothetical protein FD143_822 [Ignavibacteria bacterium]|nr:MAG: hypothetical protein FD143_822 [Ignavibacteria bacterium]KAF0160592.1 MAG: hypothetical protein FD188_1584 [Ignavibacteria bacterium]
MTSLDKSNYLRGLLVICRLDQMVSDYEKLALIRLSKILGFDPHFCSEAVERLADNQFISESLPVFSRKEIGVSFLSDSLRLAFLDGNFHLNELAWIRKVAKANGLGKKYWIDLLTRIRKSKTLITPNYIFEIEKYMNVS